MNGILNVYKEKGMTSFDVVAKLRRMTHIRRIGHTGTLDPDATGVLPICIGKGTKVVDMLTQHNKTYRATLQLGIETDTQDISGTVVQRYKGIIDVQDTRVLQGLMSFLGVYMQVPPMYSAIKKDGKRLYELARQGIEVEREARQVHVYSIDNFLSLGHNTYRFDVSCSKGTYIRTLIHDLGKKLGYGGCMTELVRTEVGPFSIENALRLCDIENSIENGTLENHIHPIDTLFNSFPAVYITSEHDLAAHNGNKLPTVVLQQQKTTTSEVLMRSHQYRIYDSENCFVGIYRLDEHQDPPILRVKKMFYE